MNSFLEKNKEALKSNSVLSYEQLEKSEYMEGIVISEQSLDQDLFQVISYNGVVKRLNSSYSPKNEAECFAMEYEELPNNQIFIVFGFGNGMILRELLKQAKGERVILVYEPIKEVFWDTFLNYDISDLLNNKNLTIVIKDINDITLHNILYHFIRSRYNSETIMIHHPEYEDIEVELQEHIIARWEKERSNMDVNKNTRKRFMSTYFTNQLYSFPLYKNQYTIYNAKKYWDKNVPIVIVGAGPSLDNDIDTLKELKGKVCIIGMDSALGTLKKHGIVPDFYGTIEPNKPIELFDAEWLKNVPLLGSMLGKKELLDEKCFPGRKVYMLATDFLRLFMKDVGIDVHTCPSGGNVGTAMLGAACELGSREIILIGHDHAYSKDGNAHTEGRSDKYKEAFIENEADMVESIDGEMIQSRYDWKIYLDWYEKFIPQLKDMGITVINATSQGARIFGTVEESFENVAKRYENSSFDINEFFDSVPVTFTEEKMIEINDKFDECMRDMNKIRFEAEKGAEIAGKLLRELSTKNQITNTAVKMSEEIVKQNKKMDSKLIYKLIDECRETRKDENREYKYSSNNPQVAQYLKMYEDALDIFEGTIEAISFLEKKKEPKIQFDDIFFEKEVRCDFEIPELMKRNWAAKMEILNDFSNLCKKHGIRYFVDAGTLLGAIRHKGFIPWDDDIDIIVMRKDFQRIIDLIHNEMSEEYSVMGMYAKEERLKNQFLQCVLIADSKKWDVKEYLKKYHGCPIPDLGIDIFPMDYIPNDQELWNVMKSIIGLGVAILSNWSELYANGQLESRICEMEKFSGVDLPRDNTTFHELCLLVDRISALAAEEESDELTVPIFYIRNENKRVHKKGYAESMEAEFENIKVPIPVGYDEWLKGMYGDYNIPVKFVSDHTYPFYKEDLKQLRHALEKLAFQGNIEEFCKMGAEGSIPDNFKIEQIWDYKRK